jgi:hypothetical protein
MPRLRTRIIPRPGGVTDLTAPTPPAQGPPEASGTTSVSLTYTHPGAPAGTTYTLSVTNIADGTAVTPSSGSGLGPYVIPTSDGLTAVHRMVASQGGQTARSDVGVIVVEEAGGDTDPGWETVLDLDLTGLTSATLTSGATTNITRASGGATVAAVWVDVNTNPGGSVTAGAAGLVLDGAAGTGSVTALIDLEAAAGLTLPTDALYGIAITYRMTGLTDWTGSGTAVQAGIAASQTRLTTGTCNAVRWLRATDTTLDRQVNTGGSYTDWSTGQALPGGDFWATLVIMGGGAAIFAIYSASGAPSDADLTALTGAVRLSSTVSAETGGTALTSLRYGAALFGGWTAQLQGRVTAEAVTVKKLRTA